MKFVFFVTKRKARRIALTFKLGANVFGHSCRVVTEGHASSDEVGVFYGVTPETQAEFCRLSSEGRALYLDNGWLCNSVQATLRWSWNSVQAYYENLTPRPERLPILKFHEDILVRSKAPSNRVALLCLQSDLYFEGMNLPYSGAEWATRIKAALELRGYHVVVRPKPSTRNPAPEPLDYQIERSSLVVSLNSAVTIRALVKGVPAFCALECTLTPACLDVIGPPDTLRPVRPKVVRDLIDRLAQVDFTYKELENGTILNEVLNVPETRRTGHVYGLGVYFSPGGRRLPSKG